MEIKKEYFIPRYLIIIFAFLVIGFVILAGYDYFITIKNRDCNNIKYWSFNKNISELKLQPKEDSLNKKDTELNNIIYIDSVKKSLQNEQINKQYIDNCINEHFSSGLVKIGFLILGVFTLLFTALTILINSYASKAENTLKLVRDYESTIKSTFESVNSIEIPSLRYKYENYIRILFITLNGYLKKKYQLDSFNLLQILKLFSSDLTEVQEAAMLLSISKEKKCIPFLEEMYKYYNTIHSKTNDENQKRVIQNVMDRIKEALNNLKENSENSTLTNTPPKK